MPFADMAMYTMSGLNFTNCKIVFNKIMQYLKTFSNDHLLICLTLLDVPILMYFVLKFELIKLLFSINPPIIDEPWTGGGL